MARYRFVDGKTLDANSPEEFVKNMRNSSYCPGDDEQDFMDLCSERGFKLGLDIRSDSEYNFLVDLIKHEIVVLDPPVAYTWN